MTYEEFADLLEEMQKEEMDTLDTKGIEYTHNSGDRLQNFKELGAECICPHCKKPVGPMMIMWIFFRKHIASIQNFIFMGREFSEPIGGRIKDARVYLSLLQGIITEERRNDT